MEEGDISYDHFEIVPWVQQLWESYVREKGKDSMADTNQDSVIVLWTGDFSKYSCQEYIMITFAL